MIAALIASACGDLASPEQRGVGAPAFSHTASGSPALDRHISLLIGAPTTGLIKGFNTINPHNGSTVIATIFWLGSENVITAVTDSLTTGGQRTPVGNTYTLVEYVTVDGISMATYVATNVQNFPDGYGCPPTDTCPQDSIYAVAASFRTTVADAGMILSAWTGVEPVLGSALGVHRSAFGSATSPTIIGPGAIAAGGNSLVYAAVMSNTVRGSGRSGAPFFTWPSAPVSNTAIKAEAMAAVQPSAWSANPQWFWDFSGSGDWVATGLELKPAGGATNQPPTANFPAPNCTGLTCSFTSTSSDPDGTIAGYNWTFGDGTLSTAQSPSKTYAAGGTYTVTLTVTDDDGASSSPFSRTVTVSPVNQAPTANFPAPSCTGLTCSFTSTSSDPDGTIASYSWTFGDGTSSTAQNPSKTYAAGGTYTVTLTVTDDDGTSSVPFSRMVTVSPANQAPTASFPAPSCTGLTCSFTSTSSDPDGTIASYNWTFGDGTSSTVQNPSKTYAAAGAYTVTLRVTDDQGATSAPFSRSVTVTAPNQPPTANFPAPGCNGLTCNFTSTSSDPDGTIASYSWTFGDGTSSTVQNPSKTYAAAGTYTVTLTVTDDDGASGTPFSRTVTVSPANQAPTANFPAPSCNGLTCSFTSTSSDPDGTIASHNWTFGDGTSSTVQNPSKTYAAAGTYTVTLTVTDDDGASSTPFSRSVTVTAPNQPPTANFTFTCSGLTCTFTSTSSDADGTIAGYSWTFGDGTSSTAQNPTHTYAAGGSYTVTLTVTDNQGASSAPTSRTVGVTPPNEPPTADFPVPSCSGLTCSFTSTSSDPDGTITSYNWTFGDGTSSTAQNPSQTYAAAGTYTVTLRVTDNQGATSAPFSRSVTVTAPNQPPTANFPAPSCSGLTCSFTSTSSDPDGTIASYSWTFGDGTSSTAQNPSHTYSAGGTYTVTLRVTDNQGALSAPFSRSVTVTAPNQAPTANFTFSCSGLTCNFTSTSSDPDGSISSYSWTFGDGTSSTAQNPFKTYGAGGSYSVRLTVTDNRGATNSITKTVTVTAPNSAPVVNAGPDETALTGLLYSLRWSFTDANHNGPWSYTINWGDGSTSTGNVSSEGTFSNGHTYIILLPRSFTITVTVRDAAGASGSDSKVVSVLLL